MNSDFSVAVHALVYLSHRGCSQSSEELADNICTNPARVRKIMAKLRRAGLVQTREGLEGGYKLALPADRVSLAQVSRALEVQFVSTTWKSGNPQKACLIASGMGDLMDELYARMDQQCQQYLEGLSVSQVEHRIFDGRDVQGSPCGGRHIRP